MQIDFAWLARKCSEVAKEKGWKTDWAEGGSYLHLEASEFVESLRGKGDSQPYEELGDVLFVLLAMAHDHNVNIDDAFTFILSRHKIDIDTE